MVIYLVQGLIKSSIPSLYDVQMGYHLGQHLSFFSLGKPLEILAKMHSILNTALYLEALLSFLLSGENVLLRPILHVNTLVKSNVACWHSSGT